MSAFLVSKEHIDALVLSAWLCRDDMKWAGFDVSVDSDKLGRMLWAECLKSVSYRYPNDKDGERPGPINFRDDEVKFYAYPLATEKPEPVAALKLLACYEYQSCEHPAWPDSDARKFCERLRHALIARLPGYEEAEWAA